MSDNELQEPFLEGPISSPEPENASPQKKRKRDADLEARDKKLAKKPKTKKQKEQFEEEYLDIEAGVNKRFAEMDSQLLADYVEQRTRQFESDLSAVELEDRHISGTFDICNTVSPGLWLTSRIATCIRDATSWDKPRTLDNLPGFLESVSPNPTKLWGASKKNGAPHTIIVAGAGQRAADLARVVRKLQSKDAEVAKLFAKHIKLQDAVKFLKSKRTGMAVGTPKRLDDLMDDGALQTDRLERIIIDASHIDQKKRGILEMRETQIPLTHWLNRKEFKDRYTAEKDKIDLIFF
jgi:protein CMS1